MRWKSHVRFGGRAGETHRQRCRQGAPVRPLHVAMRPLEPEGDVGAAGGDWWRRIFLACVMVSATWMFVLTGERRRRPTQCRAPQRPCWL